jgi:hypothetical protein
MRNLKFLSGRLALALWMGLVCGIAHNAWSQQPATVLVELNSGRKLEGFIDARSTDVQLVMRFERGGASLSRQLSWSEVRSVELQGKEITRDELRRRYLELATKMKASPERARQHRSEASPSDLQQPADLLATTPQPPLPPARVTSLSFDALLANWDADVEADGLVIYLQPLDSWQQMSAASGTLEVELYTIQARVFHHAPYNGGRSIEPIIRWTQVVNLSDYTSRGAQLKLPFQAAHPEFDDTLGAYGLVHVKFSVPGSGVFEQTMDGVRIRPWSPLRDYLQLDTGRRFLPNETTGRSKTSWPNAYP